MIVYVATDPSDGADKFLGAYSSVDAAITDLKERFVGAGDDKPVKPSDPWMVDRQPDVTTIGAGPMLWRILTVTVK